MFVLIALYNVFYQVLQNGDLAKIVSDLNQVAYASSLKITTLDLSFFGTNLGVKPSQWQTHGYWLLLIPVVTAALQWWQSKLVMPPAPAPGLAKPAAAKETEEKKPEDTALEMQRQMAMITPIMFGMFAYQFPLGLALYWNVFGLFGIIQQLQVNKEA